MDSDVRRRTGKCFQFTRLLVYLNPKVFVFTTHFTAMCTPYLFNGVRRSTQAWLQNLALFGSISSKKAKKDKSI